MRNLLLHIAYNGSRYHGYQVQQNAVSVAGTFQPVLEKILAEKVQLKGCSRTDTGVHANDFAVSFKTNCRIPCEGLVRALNNDLPPDMAALRCEEVDEEFHARYSCTGKRYIYKIRNSEIRSPFEQDQVWVYYKYPIDAEALNAAAQGFIGTYDYQAFCSPGGSVEDTVRTIYEFTVRRDGEMVEFSVTGSGFLYNMVQRGEKRGSCDILGPGRWVPLQYGAHHGGNTAGSRHGEDPLYARSDPGHCSEQKPCPSRRKSSALRVVSG